MLALVRIAIVGTGAMGSVYAVLLGDAGHEVWAIDAWQDHVDAINANGLRVAGASGDRVARIRATSNPAEVGVCDLVVVSTKAMHVDAASQAARPLVGPDTVVLPIQNGLGSAEVVARNMGEEATALGVVGGFGASIVAPGHVHHNGWELLGLGERGKPATDRIRRVAQVWEDAGFKVKVYDDVDLLVWTKLICNVCFSGTCAVLDRTISEVMNDPDAWAVASACATEAYRAGRAAGIQFAFDDPVEHVRDFGSKIPNARPSMLLDLHAGRRCEVDVINGAIPRVSKQHGLEAPTNEVVVHLVKARERIALGG